MNGRTITIIPAACPESKNINEENTQKKRRVAGYARVSTEMDEQQTSYASQIEYYTKYITGRSDWELVKIYTDEGISATNTDRRDGFNSMISDALNGKIDLIITKSVSRFARNTVDSLTAVRRLRRAGVEVYFEKENIWTLDSKGELLITIMSSLAQEESRSISENVTWGHRRRFAEGKVSLAYSRFLGYDKGDDGSLVINPEQAEIVKLIYKLYLDGFSTPKIAEELTKREIATPCGNSVWNPATIRSILSNEKYKGDALLQKSCTSDFLTKKRIKNDGEITQYYIQQSHEPIISQEMFSLVKKEHSRRSKERMDGFRYTNSGEFFGRIRCGVCGGRISIRRRHPNTKYEKIVYQCTCRYKKSVRCQSEIFKAEHIYWLFNKALASQGYPEELGKDRLSKIWKENVFNVTLYSKSHADFEFFDGSLITVNQPPL